MIVNCKAISVKKGRETLMNDDALLAVLGAVGVGVLAVFTGTQAKKNKIPITKQITNMVNDGCSFLTGEMAERYTDEQLKEAYRTVENKNMRNILREEMADRKII